ncbi:MAG TPA: ABC transporter permease [Sphaerochaeta sp.]|nr:ABC transporter permease [Sphaerochaeta sp.]HQB05192.1 ABC transporter permease [Sphaerochaeta sp.]
MGKKPHPRWERFAKHKLAMIGLFTLITLILTVLLLPVILDISPTALDKTAYGKAPSARHLLGTDDLGRDILARTLYGGRISLAVGLAAVCISALIGVPLGLLAGYYESTLGRIIMRIADIFISFPNMVLMLVVVAMFDSSIIVLILVIGIIGWPRYTRLVYSSTLSVRQKDYVEAAKVSGCKTPKILISEILPNVLSPVWVTLTFGVASAILTESTLSFLGVGVQPPAASWGNLIREALSYSILSRKPWIWMPSGILLIILTVSVNFIGDGIRDALDPQTKL